jgi:hypothetical protein
MKGQIVEVPANKVQGLPNSSLYDVRLENGNETSAAFSSIRRVLHNPQGGVLFIDEAYQLDPKNDPQGRKIFNEIMLISESHRATLTVIFGGCRKDIEENLFAFNPGAP